MAIDTTAYHDLERRFREQVEKDGSDQSGGVYLPFEEPTSRADYIFVGMEPSFGRWAESIEDAEKKIAKGFRNGAPARFTRSIERFLCQSGETYHLTDVSKGAMLVKVAARDRERRWEEWYPLLLKEIEIVGKPGAPVIAIGRKVEAFLRKRDLKGRLLYHVPHYSYTAAAHFKREAEKDCEGFKAFTNRNMVGTAPPPRRDKFSYTRSYSRTFGIDNAERSPKTKI